MKTKWLTDSALSWCLAIVSLALQAEAQTSFIAYTIPNGTVGNQAMPGLSVGNDFQVISPITISRLGVFDSGGGGIQDGAVLTVQLYERSGDRQGTLLETMTFDAASPGTQIGGCLFKPLPKPVTLLPGNYTVAAYGFDTNNPEGNAGLPPYATNAPPWTLNDGGGLIKFEGLARYANNGAGSYPGHLDRGPANRYAAGNFVFSAATLPTPSYAADYAALIAGVTNFPIEDAKHLGSIAVMNPGSFPVLAEHGGNRLVLEAAGTYNSDPNGARAVAFAHFQWEQPILLHVPNDPRLTLFENAIKWASRKSNPANIVVGVTTNLNLYFMNYLDPSPLVQAGFQVVPIDFSQLNPTNGLPPMDVLVLDGHANYDENWVPAIEAFTAAGGGLVMSLTPRYVIYTTVQPAFDYANEIMQAFGLAYRNNLATPALYRTNVFSPPNLQTVPYPIYFSAFPAAEMLYADRIGQIQLDSQQRAIALNTIAYASVGRPDLLSQLTAVYSGTSNNVIQYPGNPGDSVMVLNLAGAQATTDRLGTWVVNGSDLVAQGRRGVVEYQFNLPAADMYQLLINGAQDLPYNLGNDFQLRLSIDGQNLGQFDLNAPPTGGTLQCLLPYLLAGPHTLRVFWDNPTSYTELRLKSVQLLAGLGPDSNGNGIKDWVEQALQQQSGLDITNNTIGSYTSPVCLEGRDPYPAFISTSIEGADNNTPSLNPSPEPNRRWFVNVPLSAYVNAQTLFHVSYQNGGRSEVRNLQWLPINLLTAGNITIRQGDSLLFNAKPTNAPDGNLAIAIGTNQWTGLTMQPIARQFTAPGAFTVTGTYSLTNGSPQSGSITVNVVGQVFTNNPDCWVGWERTWDLASIPPQAVLSADTRLFFEPLARLANHGERFGLVSDQNVPRYILARLGTNGPVLDEAAATGFQLWSASRTGARVIQVYPDGSQLVETREILSPVLPDLTVRLDVIVGGVTFDDGTTSKTLAPADFDALGQCVVHLIRPASATTSTCYSISVFQGSTLIAYTR